MLSVVILSVTVPYLLSVKKKKFSRKKGVYWKIQLHRCVTLPNNAKLFRASAIKLYFYQLSIFYYFALSLPKS